MKRFAALILMMSMIANVFSISVYAGTISSLTYGGHTYKLIDEKMTWEEAKVYCERLGGHLATFTSKGEWEAVHNAIVTNSEQYWLGASDVKIEGTWEWVTGESWVYEDWCSNEPNNDYDGTEDYLGTYTSTYQWNDYRNTEGQCVLCEWDNESLSAAPIETITVIINEKKLVFDQPPYIENGTTMVPMRAIFEALGATVEYDSNTKTVTAVNGNNVIKLTVGNTYIDVNNVWVVLTAPIAIENGTMMVPVRAIAESFGADVKWDSQSQTVNITYDKNNAKVVTNTTDNSTNKDIKYRALLIAGYDDSEKEKDQRKFLDSFNNAVDYTDMALRSVGITDITKCYMENQDTYMSITDLSTLLENTFKDATDDDISIFYYSGHSYYTYEDEFGNHAGHITTFSSSSFERFYNLIASKVKGTVLLMYDGCFAGELVNLPKLDDRIKILAACDADDESSDTYISRMDDDYKDENFLNKKATSIFAYEFYDGITNHVKNMDSNEDKNISFNELYLYMLNSVYNVCDSITTKNWYKINFVDYTLAQAVQSYPKNDNTILFEY